MNLEARVGDRRFRVVPPAHDLSITLGFDDHQPAAFGLAPARANPVLTVAEGASVNCSTLTLTPHGNVTHTECVGHIRPERIDVLEVLTESWMAATLVTLAPFVVRREGHDFPAAVVTLERLQGALRDADPDFLRAVVVRTLPNDSIKRGMRWSGTNPPYIQPEAMAWLAGRGVCHFLVDLPSVDPEQDGGRLQAHRAFWDGDGSRTRTITELIFVPNALADGRYMLELQVAPFAQEALPSRPLLFAVEEIA